MIIEKATELGMALSNSDEFRRLQAAKAAMDADKHVNELVENPVFEEMMEAQHCFANLMNEVNRTVGAYIGMNTEENSSSGCSGNCSGCSGCVH